MGQVTSSQVPPAVAGQDPSAVGNQDDGVTWWCKMLARTICVIAGLFAVVMGLWSCFTFTPKCLVAGVFLMCIGFAYVILEAPCCCQFLDFIQPITQFSERRSYWQKAALYGVPPFLPAILCQSLTVMFACALLLSGGVIYGLLALGKKADRDTMMYRARGETDVEMKDTIITSEVPPATSA